MSILATFIGLAYLALNNVTRFTDDKYYIRVTVYGLCACIWIAQQLYLIGYRIKSPWYNPGFMPPDYYQKGSILMDQGNNI